jgi:hypothetical protein
VYMKLDRAWNERAQHNKRTQTFMKVLQMKSHVESYYLPNYLKLGRGQKASNLTHSTMRASKLAILISGDEEEEKAPMRPIRLQMRSVEA